MILCIEYWKGDVFLSGKPICPSELKQQIHNTEVLYDRIEDNFVALLCRMYHWQVIQNAEGSIPDVTYDRDTNLLLPLHLDSDRKEN